MSDAWGAYGVRIEGLPGAARVLAPVALCASTVTVTRQCTTTTCVEEWSERATTFNLQGQGNVRIERETLSAAFTFPDACPPDEHIMHPYFASVAAVVSRWLGRASFHAAAFGAGDGAWAVLGDKGAGKSSTIAQLALMGLNMIADDVLVVDNGCALAGPSCVDLRSDAAHRMGIGSYLGVVGARERTRFYTSPASAPVPLRGWIVPLWADDISVVRISPPARLGLLLHNQTLLLPPVDHQRFLDLAALPFYEFRRPRDWSQMAEAVNRLVGTLCG